MLYELYVFIRKLSDINGFCMIIYLIYKYNNISYDNIINKTYVYGNHVKLNIDYSH